MTPNRRILLNVVATYGRSLYALVLGLFTARWALMALGEVDYGLYGVIGGLAGFVAFFNSLLACAVGRFYAFSVGAAEGREDGIEDCRRWFSIALFMHTLVPVVLVVIGYPVGLWMVKNFLTIPSERIEACVWVWRYACVACFVGMASVPFSAMYTAKQYIAELTIYSFVTTTFNALFLYYIVTHEGMWLTWYAFWMCLMVVAPQLIICLRAVIVFPECRFRFQYVFDKMRFREILSFVGMRSVCMFSQLFSTHCIGILVNKYLGPAKNATMTIANSVNGHTSTLSSALTGAFMPAITNAAGAGDMEGMRKLAFRTCKFGALSVMLFALPLMLEIDEVLKLWLKKPPEGLSVLCVLVLVGSVMERISEGHWVSIFAVGRIGRFQVVESLAFFGTFFLAWILLGLRFDIWSVGVASLVGKLWSIVVKLWYGRSVAGLSVKRWIGGVAIPLMLVAVTTSVVGTLPRFLMSPSVYRVGVTTILCEIVFVPLVWYFVLSIGEKMVVTRRLRHFFPVSQGRV